MKNVLLIFYHFPPTGGSGVQRGLKFAKYLPEFGFRPVILCADYRFLKQPRDFTLLSELPRNTKIYRTFTLDINWFYKLLWGLKLNKVVTFLQRNVLIPDGEILWLPFALPKLKKIMAANKINQVFVSVPPFSLIFLARYLKKHYQVKVCMDFRDPWSFGIGRKYLHPPKWITTLENKWEKEIITQSDSIISVCSSMVEDFKRLYPFVAKNKFVYITNGYDEKDFPVSFPPIKNAKFTIIYTGSFYDNRQPDILWKALKELIAQGKIKPDKITVEIYGKNTRSFVLGNYVNDAAINKIVHFFSYVDHSNSIKLLGKADTLLLFSNSGEAQRAIVTAKVFEYMRSGKPILAIIDPSGAAAEILKPGKTGFIADSSSLNSVKETILNIYHLWEEDKLQTEPNWNYIQQFERKTLTAKLAEVFSSLEQ